MSFFLSLGVTLITEIFIVFFFYSKNPRFVLISIIAINAFTHPLFIGWGVHLFGLPLMIAELLVFGVEAFWYKTVFACTFVKAIQISGVANIGSLCAGFALYQIFFT